MTNVVEPGTVWFAKFLTFPDGSVTVHVNLNVVPTEAPVTLRARITPGVFDSWVREGMIVNV